MDGSPAPRLSSSATPPGGGSISRCRSDGSDGEGGLTPDRRSVGSSSDDGSFDVTFGGPVWMEDSSRLKRRSQIISNRMSSGGSGGSSASSGARPVRSARDAIVSFNVPKDRSAEKAVRHLREVGHIGDGMPEDIAGFFLLNDGKLDPSKVADYLGGEKEEQKEALRQLLATRDFGGLPLDSALRRMIALIKLPGEAQKIDRIMTLFAERYMACNPSATLDHEDTACILAFSLVMLNVDAHNDNIPQRRKMTEPQYVNNVKGICKDGSSPDSAMLRGFYSRVTRYEWSVEERQHASVVFEGWVQRKSNKKVRAHARAPERRPPLAPTRTATPRA